MGFREIVSLRFMSVAIDRGAGRRGAAGSTSDFVRGHDEQSHVIVQIAAGERLDALHDLLL
jgi:hypothetical protein